MKISESDFNNWKDNPVTKFFFEYLQKERDLRKDLWEDGGFGEDLTVLVKAQAQTEALKDIIEVDYQAIEERFDAE